MSVAELCAERAAPREPMVDVRSQTRDELAAALTAWGQPAYRTDQLLDWLYRRPVREWAEMSNLPQVLRDRLATQYRLGLPELTRRQGALDTTVKFLWRLRDGAFIESVLIPANPALYGDASDRHTLCISTQVGCAYGCRFCASGLDGWKRNLTADEMVGQVLAVERWQPERPWVAPNGAVVGAGGDAASSGPGVAGGPEANVRRVNNVVVMGMGEPLANYEALVRALGILNAPWGGGIGARKITVSTSGLAPQIEQLARQPLQFGLAISLHGTRDAVRDRIMPINRKYPLARLLAAAEAYVEAKGRMITFEYILIEGVNDDEAGARELAALGRRLHAKVNLIPYNRVEGLEWRRPPEARVERFRAILESARVPVTVRREKGQDIDAACGQLRLRTERALRGDAAGGGAGPGLAGQERQTG